MENVKNMKIEVIEGGNPNKETVTVNVFWMFRYNNRWYFKHQNGCNNIHYEQVCEKFLRDGKCEMEQNCQHRHPQICKYWKRQGCKRKENCKYLQKEIMSKREKELVNEEE